MTKTRTIRTLGDRAAGIARQTNALINAIATDGDPDDLQLLLTLQARLQAGLGQVVYGMRDSGHTDADIARALGTSRAAVSKRWPGGGRYVGAAGRYRRSPTS